MNLQIRGAEMTMKYYELCIKSIELSAQDAILDILARHNEPGSLPSAIDVSLLGSGRVVWNRCLTLEGKHLGCTRPLNPSQVASSR